MTTQSTRRNKNRSKQNQTQPASIDMTQETQPQEQQITETTPTPDQTPPVVPETPETETEIQPTGEVSQPPAQDTEESLVKSEPEESASTETPKQVSPFPAIDAALAKQTEPETVTPNDTKEVKGFKISTPEAAKVNKSKDVHGFIKHKYFLEQEQYPSSLVITIKGVEDYMKLMNVRAPVTPENGARAQSRFLQIVHASLENKDAGEAMMCFDAVLFMVNSNTETVFNERLTGRFYNRLSEPQQHQLLRMMNLLLLTANPATRVAGLAKTRLEEVVKTLRTETQRANLTAYYAKNSN